MNVKAGQCQFSSTLLKKETFFQNFAIKLYGFFCNLTDSNPASNIDEIQQNLFVFFIQILFCKIDEEIKN